jgi:hypothetical protein
MTQAAAARTLGMSTVRVNEQDDTAVLDAST